MTAMQSDTAWIYDDFSTSTLDPAKWTILQVQGADGRSYPYQDRNAELRTGDGVFELSIIPFTRFHDTNPLENNAKQMYRTVEPIEVPADGMLTAEVDMAVEACGQVPFDLLDVFSTVNLFDLNTGVVLDAAATNDTVYAIVERLRIAGATSEMDRYIHRAVLDLSTEPGQWHRYSICYEAKKALATWRVDGQRLYWASVPAPVRAFHLGMGLFSARSLSRYSREEREHGQGATCRWRPWHVRISREVAHQSGAGLAG